MSKCFFCIYQSYTHSFISVSNKVGPTVGLCSATALAVITRINSAFHENELGWRSVGRGIAARDQSAALQWYGMLW